MKTNKICPNEYEHRYWQEAMTVLGIDAAGRGPLAGPLCVAGVVFEPGYENPLIYDSKAISEKRRNELFDVIREDALYYEIRLVTPEEIDRLNIYRATQKAMLEIALEIPADAVLTDAMPLELDKPMEALVKGDQKSESIAAASILAKVTRDRIMEEYDRIYPGYGFAKNKGYPTKEHLDALSRLGITPIHRRSYGPVAVQKIPLF